MKKGRIKAGLVGVQPLHGWWGCPPLFQTPSLRAVLRLEQI